MNFGILVQVVRLCMIKKKTPNLLNWDILYTAITNDVSSTSATFVRLMATESLLGELEA